MTSTPTDVSALRAIWLVARREIMVRVVSKPFLISTGIILALVVVGAVLFSALDGGSDKTKVALAKNVSQYESALLANAEVQEEDLAIQIVPNVDVGRALVKDKSADVFIYADAGELWVVVRSELSSVLEQSLNAVAYRAALDQQIVSLGGNPQMVDAQLQASSVEVEKLNPPREFDDEQLALGAITGILIYMALMMTGQMVAQGVVEEKSSRVVEILLASIPPIQLLGGKVLGIGVVGLIQVAIIGIGGAGVALAVGALTISISAAGSTVAWLIVWFVLGYVFYALAFAAAGALVSRQEDIGGVMSPMMTLLIIGYLIGVVVLPADPGNNFSEVLSMIPAFAPTMMPVRLAMGGVPAWQSALSVGLVLVSIPVLTWASARIYRRAIVRTGARVKLREVL